LKSLGRVVVYGSLGLRPGLSELLWAFRKGHKLEEFPVYLDDHPYQVLQRIKSEVEHGMRTADVVLMPHYMLLRMSSDGMLSRHETERVKDYPSGFHGSSKDWFAVGKTFMGMAYDSKKTRERELPRTLEDLSAPRFRGRLGTQSLTSSKVGNLGVQYLAFLRKVNGQRRWGAFVNGLASSNRPNSYDCIDHLIQGLLDGECKLALTVYSLAFAREKTAGAPVSILHMRDAPQMLTFTSVGLTKSGGENESAKRFVDFLLSRRAQNLIGRIPGIAPAMPSVENSFPLGVDLSSENVYHPTREDLRDLPGVVRTFQKLGLP
jgi:iron(III) transport system substrate-binding protein